MRSEQDRAQQMSHAGNNFGMSMTSRHRLFVLAVALAVVLAVVAAVAARFASTEHDSARSNAASAAVWQARADDVSRALVATRSQLDAARAQITDSNTRIKGAQRSIKRLEKRQRELVNEKDQLGDERLFLQKQQEELQARTDDLAAVATAYITCSSGLNDVVQALANNDAAWLDANYPDISASCDQARAALDEFNGNT